MVLFSRQFGLGLFTLLERHWCYFLMYTPVNDDGMPFNVVNNGTPNSDSMPFNIVNNNGTLVNLGTPDSVDTPNNANLRSNSCTVIVF